MIRYYFFGIMKHISKAKRVQAAFISAIVVPAIVFVPYWVGTILTQTSGFALGPKIWLAAAAAFIGVITIGVLATACICFIYKLTLEILEGCMSKNRKDEIGV